jgi:hypothetical protein
MSSAADEGLQRSALPTSVDHAMTVCAHDGEIVECRAAPPLGCPERTEMMHFRESDTEGTVSLFEVKPATWNFAAKPAVSHCRKQLLCSQAAFAPPMHHEPNTRFALERGKLIVRHLAFVWQDDVDGLNRLFCRCLVVVGPEPLKARRDGRGDLDSARLSAPVNSSKSTATQDAHRERSVDLGIQ